jgi:cystathionine beta-synthase
MSFNLLNSEILGMVTLGSLLTHILHKKLEPTDKVESALYRQFKKVRLEMNLGKLTYILNTDHFALVIHSQIECKYYYGIWKKFGHA